MRTPESGSEIVVGLDLGTTKVSAVVGEVDSDGITILGVGNVPCRGLRKGVVSNIEWTVRSIREAHRGGPDHGRRRDLRRSTPASPAATSGPTVSDGVCAIAGREVTRADLDRVLEGARAIPVDADRMILHALPREYVVDNQDGIRDPIGMSGVRLQVRVNLVTAATSCVQNVIRCVERCGLHVAEVVLEPLASADAVLSDDEKEIGVAVIDIGGGTTDLAALRRRRHRPHQRHPRWWQQHHQRRRGRPANADGRGRALEAQLRLRPGPDDRGRRGDRGPGRRRACAAPRRAALAQRHHRAARRRDLQRGPAPHRRDRTARAGKLGLRARPAAPCSWKAWPSAREEILGMPVRLGFPVGVKGIVQLVQGPQYATGCRPGALRREPARGSCAAYPPAAADDPKRPKRRRRPPKTKADS